MDHTGVPNAQLVAEQTDLAAEQNSVHAAWNLLRQDDYIELRRNIYVTNGKLQRFRQLVVNSVMATDSVETERNLRWE